MITPLLQGLKITLAHMFKKPITLQYPDERPEVRPTFRGLHALKVSHDRAKCVACYLCPTVCPAKCITVEAGEDAKHDKYAAKYEIDLLRCIFCGYCVEACPVDALKMTETFELANYTRADFVFTKERLLEKK
jgi:NADH-quinone oxidoreductase subunit I